MMNLYVYKCLNDPAADNAAYGDWEEVFRRSDPTYWGGEWSTNRPMSRAIVRDKLRKGDLILAWQTDKKSAIGICEVARLEDDEEEGRVIYLRPLERFPKPVRINELKRTTHPHLMRISAFKQGNAAMIYELSTQEARWLLDACGSKFSTAFKPPP